MLPPRCSKGLCFLEMLWETLSHPYSTSPMRSHIPDEWRLLTQGPGAHVPMCHHRPGSLQGRVPPLCSCRQCQPVL